MILLSACAPTRHEEMAVIKIISLFLSIEQIILSGILMFLHWENDNNIICFIMLFMSLFIRWFWREI